MPGDLQNADHCRAVIRKAVDELGGIDILVNNAAHQATFKNIGDISDEEWETTFKPIFTRCSIWSKLRFLT